MGSTAPDGKSYSFATGGIVENGTIGVNAYPPRRTLVDLDYPMFGRVVVKCKGREYSLADVQKALRLLDEAREVSNG